ncbi:hypothetical protein H2201_001028 [Coniosporium apollinis]|uniref:Csi2 protein n=1 Tax=Coniosporium apollinis TaxID=61459 RepID=A0ABQ9P7C1_9PEZI|nr:hypothetical protein H2201_001028 [Coniosporium apollinis]
MRLSAGSLLDPTANLYSTLALLLLTSSAYAQSDLPDLSTAERPGEASTTADAPSSTTRGRATTTEAESTAEATETAEPTESSTESTAESTAASDETTTALRAAPVTSAPSIPTSSIYHLTNVPTIAGAGIPTMVVPYTANAPFMQKTTLPEGTVFICAGAILGFLGASILAWRGLVAWSLHRSVKRAALGQNYPSDIKSAFRAPGSSQGGLYSAAAQGSVMSLDRMHSASGGVGKVHRGATTPSRGSLFFSPTADTGLHGTPDRNSGYLPAGFYSATAASPAGGAGITHIGGSPSTSVYGSPAQGYPRTKSYVDATPPASPGLHSHRSTMLSDRGGRGTPDTYARSSMVGTVGGGYMGTLGQSGSSSTLNLTVPGGTSVAGARTPSAYLEDLFESHGQEGAERF